MSAIDLVLSKLPKAKRCGKGYSSRCPAHDDRMASLSIAEGEDGQALIHCHAGCAHEAICGKLGLRLSDLFTARSTDSTFNGNGSKFAKKSNTVERTSQKPSGPTFDTAQDAIAELERRNGPRSAHWTYYDANGNPVGVIVRWDRLDGKDIRPVALIGERWHLGGMPEPRPLYCLPKVTVATTVYVCEGEKAADAVQFLGLTATTSAHGSQSPSKTDWTPLAGKQVVILPDNDKAGRDYAETVAAILGKLTPTPTMKIVELPDLPDKGDAVEWIAALGDQPAEAKRAELERLAHDAEAILSDEPSGTLQRFVPFPIDCLPRPINDVVKRAAKAIGCDSSFIVLPLLAALGASIGNTRRLRVKGGWEIPPIIWTAIVAHSGAAKSPAIDVARKPIQERQRQALRRYKEERETYEAATQEYQRDLKDYQNSKRNDAPERPVEPVAERYWIDDVTMEAVAARLQAQPRGLLLIRDELAGWFGGFDRYVGNKGGDAARWLECYGGRPMLKDRASGEPIHVDRASVCVTGSIQPAILRTQLSEMYRQNGLAARILFAFPPQRTKRWNDAEIEQRDFDALALIFERLYELQFGFDADGEPAPIVLRMDEEAKTVFVAYFNAHNEAQADLSDDLSAAWSKLEEYAARLAMIVHYVRWAAKDLDLSDEMTIDAVSMEAGITLARWFANEARRIYAMLSETDDDAERRKLIDWIAVKGGRVTPRTLQQGKRAKSSGDAVAKLQDLVDHDLGRWEPTPSGQRGQPTRWFTLVAFDGNSEITEGKPNTVEVETVDEAEESGLWSEI